MTTPTTFPSHIPMPTGTQYYAAPTGLDTNNGLSAATPKTLKGAIQAAPSGSLIWLADGRYSSTPITGGVDANYVMPAKTLTLWAMNQGDPDADPLGDGEGAYGPRFERKVIVDGLWRYDIGRDYTWGYVAFTTRDCMTDYPDAFAGETWQTVGLGSDVNYNNPMHRGEGGSLRFWRCEGYTGYGRDQEAFDPTRKYDEFKSPNPFYFDPDHVRKITDTNVTGSLTAFPGWGDGDWCPYNTLMWGPGFASKRFANLVMEECYIHDMGTMIGSATHTGKLEITRNWFARTILDLVQTSLEVTTYTSHLVHGNIFQDSIGDSKDSCNPHCDVTQHYMHANGGTVTAPLKMLRMQYNNNFHGYSHGCRGKPQALFHQTSFDAQQTTKACYVGKRVRNNVLIGVYKGHTDSGSRDLYFTGNILINPAGFTSSGNTQPAAFDTTRQFIAGGTLRSDAGPSRNFLYGNIMETLSLNGGAEAISLNNLVTGYQGSSVAFSGVFADANDSALITTPNDWWLAVQRTPAHASKGPQYASLRDMLSAAVDFTGEQPWVGFLDMLAQPLSTQIVSNTAFIHGGDDGDTLAMTDFPSNAEWRMLDTDESTVLTAWSNAASGTLVVGKFLQLRQTTPATHSTLATVTFDVAGDTMSWPVSTQARNVYPETNLDGAVHFKVVNTTSMGLSNSKTLWFYFRGKPAASQNNQNTALAYGFTGSQMFGGINISTGNKINATFRDATAAVASTGVSTTAVTRDGNTLVEWLIAVDTSKASWAEGMQVYQRVDGGDWASVRSGTASTWVQNAEIDLSTFIGSGQKNIYLLGSVNTYYAGDVQALALGTGALDITDSAVRDRFTADNIGELMKGPNGIRPLWALVGQRQTGGSLLMLGSARTPVIEGSGTTTAGTPQDWPVPLDTMLAASPGPYAVGTPITITLKPLGYISAGSSVTLSASSSSIFSGSFDASTKSIPEGTGGVSFSFTPATTGAITISGDVTPAGAAHSDPAPLVLTI